MDLNFILKAPAWGLQRLAAGWLDLYAWLIRLGEAGKKNPVLFKPGLVKNTG